MRRAVLFPAGLAAAGLICWSAVAHPWGWLYGFGVHPYPASSSTPWTYQMWSGILPALTIVTLLSSVASAWRLHNCHVPRCWHLGRYPVAGGQFRVCRRHHPDGRVRQGTASHEHILQLHREHAERSARA